MGGPPVGIELRRTRDFERDGVARQQRFFPVGNGDRGARRPSRTETRRQRTVTVLGACIHGRRHRGHMSGARRQHLRASCSDSAWSPDLHAPNRVARHLDSGRIHDRAPQRTMTVARCVGPSRPTQRAVQAARWPRIGHCHLRRSLGRPRNRGGALAPHGLNQHRTTPDWFCGITDRLSSAAGPSRSRHATSTLKFPHPPLKGKQCENNDGADASQR